ncbi:MAG TPA: hypothetical protein VIX86_18515 [Streptosporangiaceae bacterium]
MIRPRPRRRSEAQLAADLNDLLRPYRSSPFGAPWRWRYELALVAGLTMAAVILLRLVGAEATVLAASALAGLLSPPWPPPLRAAAWHVITPHRLRSGMAHARIQSRRGRLPFIVRTLTTPYGERVLLWCRAGTSAEDLRSARALLRAACWASDIQVTADEQGAHLVCVDVIRRGPVDDDHPDDAGHDPAAWPHAA